MKELAEIALPDDAWPRGSFAFSADGSSLLLGTNRLNPAAPWHTLGVFWLDWAAMPPTSRAVPVPASKLEASLDASAAAFDLDGDRALVIASSNAPTAPNHDQLWVTSRKAGVAARLLADAPGFSLNLFLSPDRRMLAMFDGTNLVALHVPTGSRKSLPLNGAVPVCFALNAMSTHVAVATAERVFVQAIGGVEVASWPSPGKLTQLSFAPDDLALWGATRDAGVQLPFGAPAVPWAVPDAKPVAIDAVTRTALFAGREGFTLLELSTGNREALGPVRGPIESCCWDAKRRRLGTLSRDGAAAFVRVHQG